MMERIFTILVVFVFMMSACSPKINMNYQRTGLVNCVKHDRMTITLESEAQAETMGKAIGFAERNAMENLLFKGIPNSNQEKPLIDNERKAMNEHGSFLQDFLSNSAYQEFITSSMISDDYIGGGIRLVNQRIVVDLTNLRSHLEKNRIVQKFGIY